jgi:hypothetical protein
MAKKLKRLSKAAFLDTTSDFLKLAREMLQRDGYLDMVVAWVTDDRNIWVTDSFNEALMVAEDLHKQGRHQEAGDLKKDIWNAVRQHLEEQKAIGYFTMSDSFVTLKQFEKGGIAFGEQPGQILIPDVTLPRLDPTRREAIALNWEWKGPPENIHTSGHIRQFYRREGNRIIMEEIERAGAPAGGAQEGLLR